MIAHCRCTPMPLNSATAPAYTADAAKMATSQLRPIAATDPGAAADPGAASPEGLLPPLRSGLKASRDAHILHLTSPGRFLATPGAVHASPAGPCSRPGWAGRPGGTNAGGANAARRCERPRLLHGRPVLARFPARVPGQASGPAEGTCQPRSRPACPAGFPGHDGNVVITGKRG